MAFVLYRILHLPSKGKHLHGTCAYVGEGEPAHTALVTGNRAAVDPTGRLSSASSDSGAPPRQLALR